MKSNRYNFFFSYATCIRQEEGYCCVRYSLCADTNSWDIDNSQTAASGIGSECTYDYVGIQGKIVLLL